MKLTNIEHTHLSYFRGHEEFISKAQDQIRLVRQRNRILLTSFLSPVELHILETMVPKDVQLVTFGGYKNAERKVACLLPLHAEPFFDLVCLHACFDSSRVSISHRDILGSLMSLGIERNRIGDLIIDHEDIFIFIKEKLADYIISSFVEIKHFPLSFSIYEGNCSFEHRYELIKVNVSSLRMDCIVAGLAHCSRSQALALIKKGQVKLNDIVLEESRNLCNNDYVSIRRIGRFKFTGVSSTTRKERLVLSFEKYI